MLYVFSQAWGELGGQEQPWTSGDKVGDGRNIGRSEAGVPNGKFPGDAEAPRGARVAVPPSGSCSWILEKKELRLWGWGWGEEWVYYQT